MGQTTKRFSRVVKIVSKLKLLSNMAQLSPTRDPEQVLYYLTPLKTNCVLFSGREERVARYAFVSERAAAHLLASAQGQTLLHGRNQQPQGRHEETSHSSNVTCPKTQTCLLYCNYYYVKLYKKSYNIKIIYIYSVLNQ